MSVCECVCVLACKLASTCVFACLLGACVRLRECVCVCVFLRCYAPEQPNRDSHRF